MKAGFLFILLVSIVAVTTRSEPVDPPTKSAAPAQVTILSADECQPAIIAGINSARTKIRNHIYSFTDEAIADALIMAQGRGVDVAVMMDEKAARSVNEKIVAKLEAAHVPLWFDGKHPIAHAKYFTFDGKTAILGSYNQTQQARHNHEISALITDGATVERLNADWNIHQAHAVRDLPRVKLAARPPPSREAIAQAWKQPDLRPVSDGAGGYLYVQVGDFQVGFQRNGVAYWLVIPDGFISDGTSVPRWVESISGIERDGLERRASWVHDYLYTRQGSAEKLWTMNGWEVAPSTITFNREDVDAIFHTLLLDSGVSERRADVMHEAVRLFGHSAWDSHFKP